MTISHFFPNRKLPVIVAVVIAIVVIGGVFYAQHHKGSNPGGELAVKTNATTTADASGIDTDHDGLQNWQEALWGTNPKKADTDGDGTSDGQEVSKGRDPTIPGPDDTLKSLEKTNVTSTALEYAKLTPQEKATRNFFAQFLQLNADGGVSEQEETNLSNGYTTEALQDFDPNTVFKTYTEADLTVSRDNSQNALKKYGNQMGEVYIINPLVDKETNKLTVFLGALHSGKQEDFEKLAPYVARYSKILSASLQVPVPPSAVSIQLKYLNALSALKTYTVAMEDSYDTPLKSGVIINLYRTQKKPEILETLNDISQFFTNHHINYNKNEPGHLFAVSTSQT